MRSYVLKSLIIAALASSCISFYAAAAEPQVVYEGGDALLMPGTEAMDPSVSEFGCITSPSVFENAYTAFSISIPEGYEADMGGEVFYDSDGAITAYGYVPDLLLSSYRAYTVETPDPEIETDDTSVLMTYFMSKKKSDGSDLDLNAYLLGVINNIIRNDRLLPYVKTEFQMLGRNTYLAYKLDYTEAIQAYYHTVYAKYDEHPAFDERYTFKAELYCRDLGDKYYVIMYVRNGERFESSADLTSYIF